LKVAVLKAGWTTIGARDRYRVLVQLGSARKGNFLRLERWVNHADGHGYGGMREFIERDLHANLGRAVIEQLIKGL
jgi:hypothetical protein